VLRRKLMLNFAPIIALLAMTAIGAIWALQNVLSTQTANLAGDHEAMLTSLRSIVIGLTIVFLVLIHVSAFILMRMAAAIVRPMDMLTAATNELAAGHFDHRIDLTGPDEFAQLAGAFNDLASKLQEQEQRKMELLSQAALTLNHELNNCISIIQLQLRLVSRDMSSQPQMEQHLCQIRGSLERMTSTVRSLKQIRRIVLTDYIAGMKMLDLEKSVQSDDELVPATTSSSA
jgi:two-component system sensor histidine kinase MtrB